MTKEISPRTLPRLRQVDADDRRAILRPYEGPSSPLTFGPSTSLHIDKQNCEYSRLYPYLIP